MAERKRQRKMVNIDVSETSGVDHPAHLHEGWCVIKSATGETVDSIFGAGVKKGVVVADDKNAGETVAKADHDAALEQVETLKAELETANTEKDAAVAKAAELEAPADDKDDVTKAMPESVKAEFAKQAEDLKKAREDFEKERSARLDEKAIAKSRTTYKSIAFDHEKVAPALRRIAEADPELAAAVETALGAADGQLESAGIFQELGATGQENSGDATAQIDAAAQELVDAGTATNKSDGIAKALAANPALYKAYMDQKDGK